MLGECLLHEQVRTVFAILQNESEYVTDKIEVIEWMCVLLCTVVSPIT
jgi:hypothetical protein